MLEVPVEPELVEGVVVEGVEPILVPLLEGVHGATVVLTPVLPCVPGFCEPRVPPVTLPALPATPGVPGVTAGDPVELAPGVVVVAPGVEVVCPGVVVVVLGLVVVVVGLVVVVVGLVVCGPIPGLGVTVPVFWAAATPTARANTDDASKILRMEACSFARIAVQICWSARATLFLSSIRAFIVRCRWQGRALADAAALRRFS